MTRPEKISALISAATDACDNQLDAMDLLLDAAAFIMSEGQIDMADAEQRLQQGVTSFDAMSGR
ncbi:hypothetical protein [Sulfitobacter sp. 20_GPM-1509m]|uniref:hypothetical protein n=1 Tax=Sulfitobacter sp. 20_GPM-1509m TaxID=1380367 RepID=UPI00048D1571|nr:hypothetical protein [Sulfitobacter sp. 20_GPM-1509m]